LYELVKDGFHPIENEGFEAAKAHSLHCGEFVKNCHKKKLGGERAAVG